MKRYVRKEEKDLGHNSIPRSLQGVDNLNSAAIETLTDITIVRRRIRKCKYHAWIKHIWMFNFLNEIHSWKNV